MPLYKTSEEWTHYTTLLLRARPTTTRIVTKYTIPPLPSKSKVAKLRAKKAASNARRSSNDASAQADSEVKSPADHAAEKPPVAYLELRAYDPESGACLKYRTEKAAEVGRLIGGLGRMGRVMAALPEVEEKEDVVMGEAGEDEKVEEKAGTEKAKALTQQTGQQQGGQAQGGKGKKKKGKR